MKKAYAILFAIIMAAPTHSAAAEQYCELKQSSIWQRWLSDFSSTLSSTNPQSLAPMHYNSYASGSGPVRTIIYEDSSPVITTVRPKPDSKEALGPMNPIYEAQKTQEIESQIRRLPALHGGQNMQQTQQYQSQYQQPQNSYVQLSPATKKMLDRLPSRIGTERKSRKQSINISRGAFALDSGPSLNDFGSENADLDTPTFQLEVKSLKPSEHGIDLLEKALKALNAGQYEGAVAMYKSVLAKDRRNRDALFGLATTYHKSGQKAQARKAYSKLLRYHPKYQPGLNNMLLLAAQEAPQDALKELNAIQKKSPDFDAVYAHKAGIYNKMGLKEDAISSLLKAVSLSPGNNSYKYNLAILLDEAGHVVKASEIYQDLIMESDAGQKLPVSREKLIERMDFITAGTASLGR